MAKETILVVDGDTRSRKILEVSFRKSGYRVLMTESIAEALEALKRETPDLIVSDTQLPDGDGFSFCKEIKEHPDWDHVPFLFLTEESSLPRKIKGLEIGADDYLTRPLYIKEVTTRVEVLLQKRDRQLLSEGKVEEFEGELSDITFIDLLQTIDEEERNGLIEFERDGRTGLLMFGGGEVLDASCGKLQGEDAVYRLMLWPSGTFVVKYHQDIPGERHIDRSIEDLLLEGIHRLQEWERIVGHLPSLDRVFEADYQKLPELLDRVPDEVGRIIRLFDGYRALRDVIDDSPVGDVTSVKIIKRIFDEDVLRDVTEQSEREFSGTTEKRSHLADWLESTSEEAFEREENTSPGYPGGGRTSDPSETQEIEHDDLATALSSELHKENAEQGEAADGGAPGRRYMPAEGSGRDFPSERRGGEPPETDGGQPVSVDKTLRELEEAERLRRQEEAKRLVEQKHEEPEEEGEPSEVAELRGSPEEGVPRIPGATRTREGAEASGEREAADEKDPEAGANETETAAAEKQAPVEEESPDTSFEDTDSGQWAVGSQPEKPIQQPPQDRGRENTPRARPSPDSASPWGDVDDPDENPEKFQSPDSKSAKVGETGLEEGGALSGVPVSFETVEGEPSESDEPGEDEEDVRSSAERRAVSIDEAESVKDEASEAVRESARKALEEAAAALEGAADEGAEDEKAEGEESSARERENTIPFGQPVEDERPAVDIEESDIESVEKVERVSTNGEIVRAEYDLSTEEEDEPTEDLLEADAERAEAESGEPEASVRDRSVTEKLPTAESREEKSLDDTQDGIGYDKDYDEGLAWEDEPTARPIEPSDAEASEESGESPEAAAEAEAEQASVEDEGDEEVESGESFVDSKDEDTDEADDSAAETTDEWPGGRASPPDLVGEDAVDEAADEEVEAREPDDVEEPEEQEEKVEENEADEADVETEEEEGDEESVGALSDSSNEASFFEEGEEESYDWDFDEDYEESSGGRWPYVVSVLVIIAVGGAWAAKIGPFAEKSDQTTDVSTEAVATTEEPEEPKETNPKPEKIGEEDEEAEEEQVEPPKSFGSDGAKTRAQKTAASAGQVAQRTAMILGGKDPFLAKAGDSASKNAEGKKGEKGQKKAEKDGKTEGAGDGTTGTKVAANKSTSGSNQATKTSGGNVSRGVGRVRQLISAKQYSKARSVLRDLQELAPNDGRVARLYLDLASGLQIEGSVQQAKQAYRNYLDMKPEGRRASEVRSILNRL